MHSASGGDFFRHEIVRLHQTVGHNINIEGRWRREKVHLKRGFD